VGDLKLASAGGFADDVFVAAESIMEEVLEDDDDGKCCTGMRIT
jgi:hypothetical protein